ncbi:AAA family ATPase [Photobacterium kishitanii]|uniref:AAA family ATPase n=1 Tax=Photobacterium kishitanii TaxID=318456 RepID=UPI0015E68644|nr:AAA family ATPase [Photobacterium kishitanii]
MNLPLREVLFVKDFRGFRSGDRFQFKKQVTLLSGDNGAGKSTLISEIRTLFKSYGSFHPSIHIKAKPNNKISGKCEYIDLAGGLLKSQSYFSDDSELQIHCLYKSFGESALMQLLSLLKNFDGAFLIIDEPERGMSSAKQFIIAKLLKKWVISHPDVQVLIVTHSFEIMDEFFNFDSEISELKVLPGFVSMSPTQLRNSYRAFSLTLWKSAKDEC